MKLSLKDQHGTLRPLQIIVEQGDRTTSLVTLLDALIHRLGEAEEAISQLQQRHTEPLPDDYQ